MKRYCKSTKSLITTADDVGYEDYRDNRLDAIEDTEAHELDATKESIDVTLDKIKIEVNSNSSWDYLDESYPWVVDTTLNESIDWDLDPVTIVEDFDRIVEPYIPMDPGIYQISCDATLVYELSNLFELSEGSIDTSDAYVRFIPKDSAIFNFKYSEKL